MTDYSASVFVFDLDGVITNPKDTSVNVEVIKHISEILQNDGHVAVNTGRSYAWVELNLINPLQQIVDQNLFSRLYIVCEKGGESMVWQGERFEGQPSRFALDSPAYRATNQTFVEHKDELSTMFWDSTKRTMATIEKIASSDLDLFHKQQKLLVEILKQNTQGCDVRIDATTIATDVESPSAGKHAGAELIYEWVRQHTNITHESFTCFGDSLSDYEMARYFAEQGASTTFVFVGMPSDTIDEDKRVKTIRTKAQYDSGTLEYFESLK